MRNVNLWDRRLDRRGMLKLGAGAAAGMAFAPLAACGSSERGGGGGAISGTLEQWEADPRDQAIQSAEWWGDAFARRHDGTTVETVAVPTGTEATKLRAAGRGGQAPEVIRSYQAFHTTWGQEDVVVDVGQTIDAIGRDRFLPAALEGIEFSDGRIYSVPLAGYPVIVYYRKDLYDKAGLEPPTTHEQLLENARRLHDPPNVYGYMLYNGQTFETLPMQATMWTHGAYYFDEGDKLAIDRPETLDAWAFYKELGQLTPPGAMGQGDLQSRALIQDGKVAHALTSTSFPGSIPDDQLGLFGAFPFPKRKGARGAPLDFHGNCVPTASDKQDAGRAMIEFVMEPRNYARYLAKTVVGWIPMTKDAYTEDFYSIPAIAKRREFVEVGREVANDGVVGIGYFGPTEHGAKFLSSGVEKAIGDRLVVEGQQPDEVMEFAVGELEAQI